MQQEIDFRKNWLPIKVNWYFVAMENDGSGIFLLQFSLPWLFASVDLEYRQPENDRKIHDSGAQFFDLILSQSKCLKQ